MDERNNCDDFPVNSLNLNSDSFTPLYPIHISDAWFTSVLVLFDTEAAYPAIERSSNARPTNDARPFKSSTTARIAKHERSAFAS